MYSEILYDVADSIATITLHRPAKLNAFTNRMMYEPVSYTHLTLPTILRV